ncbi:MAG: hypothetical protein UW82_C0017G0001, partial [candidate division WWE3 bacterium GW2011_GWC2_44_9]
MTKIAEQEKIEVSEPDINAEVDNMTRDMTKNKEEVVYVTEVTRLVFDPTTGKKVEKTVTFEPSQDIVQTNGA